MAIVAYSGLKQLLEGLSIQLKAIEEIGSTDAERSMLREKLAIESLAMTKAVSELMDVTLGNVASPARKIGMTSPFPLVAIPQIFAHLRPFRDLFWSDDGLCVPPDLMAEYVIWLSRNFASPQKKYMPGKKGIAEIKALLPVRWRYDCTH